ncbi:propionyl-CoA carboxylase alpha chain [Batrachochytrium salamandrivorans]|nr:propionyl-CoA carboxylase alpha chain [Batrachochytrium salamandrivorans]
MSALFRLVGTATIRQALDRPFVSVRAASISSQDTRQTFDKILIANRGEIACRVIRTAKKMGIKTVAIYSDADVNSLHVRLADEAVNVKTGAQAVHPGYGFLSENSQFVHALDAIGAVFIGPNESAMAAMGDKIQSKIIAKKANVTTIPGFDGVVNDVDHAIQIANEIGYPVMVKASAGGGGKGMRIAWNDKEAREAFKILLQRHSLALVIAASLLKSLLRIPVILRFSLLEISMEMSSISLSESALFSAVIKRQWESKLSLLLRMSVTILLALAKFLVDPRRNFYFLEMNTRLQVEHPITEYITGLDLVEQMIRVAAKQKLDFKQSDIKINGWAFESRVYAEDPENTFLRLAALTSTLSQ